MTAFEQRKNRDMNKKFNKQVAALRKEEKLRSTKNEIKDVKNLRGGGGSNVEAVDKELEKVLERNKKRMGRGEGDRTRSQKSFKRAAYVTSAFNVIVHSSSLFYFRTRNMDMGVKRRRKLSLMMLSGCYHIISIEVM